MKYSSGSFNVTPYAFAQGRDDDAHHSQLFSNVNIFVSSERKPEIQSEYSVNTKV